MFRSKLRWFAAAAFVGAAVLGAMPANAAPATPQAVTPHTITCVYEGQIHSDIHNYLNDQIRGNGGYVFTTGGGNVENWCVQKASQGGYYLLPVSYGYSQCLDGGSQAVGTGVQLWDCNGTQDQRWCWNGAGYLVRPNIPSVAAKDNGGGETVTLASGNASQWYIGSGSIPDSC